MVEREKILEALETIKEICTKSTCDECPLRSDGYEYVCMLHNTDIPPIDWKLNTAKGTWRAFYN